MALILVATEDADVRLMLRQLYDQLDYTLVETSDGNQCLAVTVERRVDLIVLDAELSSSDSFTLCAHLFASTRAPILMVIPDNLQMAESAFTAGASDVIVKPLHLTTLHYRLRHLLRVSEIDVLIQQEEWHRSIVENALGAIYRSTTDGRFLFVNQALVNLLGYESVEEVLALRIPEDVLFHPDLREGMRAELEQRTQMDDLEVVWKKKNGDVVVVSAHARVIRDLQGQVLYYEGIAFDITRRKQIEAAEREQRLLAEALRDTAAALNSTLDVNEVFNRILMSIGRVVPHDSASIMLIEGDEARLVGHRGFAERGNIEAVSRMRFSISNSEKFRRIIAKKAAFVYEDAQTEADWIEATETAWIRGHIGVPIIIRGEVTGLINVDSATGGAFSQRDAEKLQAFADQAAIAIDNARQAEALEQRVAERTAELDLQRLQLQTILDAMQEGVTGVIFGETIDQIVYRYMNQALVDLLGYSSEDWSVFRLRPDNITEADFETEIRAARETAIEKGVWKGQQRFKAKNGQERDTAVTISSVRNSQDKVIGSVLVMRDISQEKALDDQKARFVASAAHELRTPITSLKTRLYLAQAQPAQMEKHLQVLERVTDQLERLVDQLLDLSRFEHGLIVLHREVINLQSFIQGIIEIQGAEAERKGIALHADLTSEAMTLEADPTRINQVITNLLNNAIQHTEPQGTITVRLKGTALDDVPYAVIQIEDTGSGIEDEHLQHIFEPFYRVRKGSGRGMGLGLSISKEIVGLHGGQLIVESRVGSGTCFSVCLPLPLQANVG